MNLIEEKINFKDKAIPDMVLQTHLSMKKLILLLVALASACKPGNNTDRLSVEMFDETDTKYIAEKEALTRVLQPTDTIATAISIRIINNELALDPFGKDFYSILRDVGHYELEKLPRENIHIDNQVDTILNARFDYSTIEYFKSQAGDDGFMLSANIRSPKVALRKGIKTGMSKADFIALFEELKGKEEFNVITISDLEGLQSVDFLFVNDKLAEINFIGYFD